MQSTKVRVVMTHNPTLIPADASLMQAAQKMQEIDCGVLPVGNKDKPEGIITDRDIVIRAVASGKNTSNEKVRDYMTTDVFYCKEEDSLERAAMLMHQHHVNRLLVQDETGAVSGIISFGCILRKDFDMEELGEVVECALGRKAA